MKNRLIIEGEEYTLLCDYLRKAEEAQDAYMEEADKFAGLSDKVKALQEARNQRRSVVFHHIKMLMGKHR